MRSLLYLAAITAIADGVLHLMFPNRWDYLWVEDTRRVVPGLGNALGWLYQQFPIKRRLQGLVYIGLGALFLWLAGPAEVES